MDAAPASVATGGKIAAIVALVRPHQWLKNGVVLAPLVFAHRLLDPHAAALALVAVAACCAISSAGYVLNDLLDLEQDRLHPTNRKRRGWSKLSKSPPPRWRGSACRWRSAGTSPR